MSLEAAKSFGISQADLLLFLSEQKAVETVKPVEVSDRSKHVILIISILLFALALVTCGCTLCLWVVSKQKKNGSYSKLKDESEKADLACDEASLKDSLKGTPSLPQISDKPKLDESSFQSDNYLEEEELKKLRVKDLDVSSHFYVNRNQLQVNVKKVELSAVDDNLSQNAFIYVIISLLPEKLAFVESELRPITELNYFEHAAEFHCESEEITSRTLKVTVYACDRFSQHRQVNEYTYNLSVDDTENDDAARQSVVPVNLLEVSRSPDDETHLNLETEGEVLFSLCYMPTSGRLTFVALKGRSISDDKEVPIVTYLRVSLIVLDKIMKTVQTSSVRRSTAPVYNEAFVFHTPLERIQDTAINVSVMTYGDAGGQPKVLGQALVSPKADNNLGRKHWEAMLATPRKPIAQWHALVQP